MINQDTTERIAGDLKSLRIQSGDVILVHSSLKSLQLSYDSFIRCGNVLKAQTFVIESQGLKMARKPLLLC